MACREFFRVLRPGGVFVAVREHVISRPEDLPAFLCAHPLHDRYGGENAFMLDEYKRAIKSAGFRLEQTLAPLRSPINFAPYDSPALRRELASRASAGVPIVRELLRAALSLPPVWALALPVLETLDHRPGRLYSFCARRPP
jgi:hypothetical protein